jgi:hypothetical protein
MFRKSVAVKVLIPTVLVLLATAGTSQAQPGHPQGTGRIGGSGSYSGGSGGYYSSPATMTQGTANSEGGYQSLFPPDPERNGWQTRSDGWYYYWSQNQLVGAYDPDGQRWYAYSPQGWGKGGTPPWKGR